MPQDTHALTDADRNRVRDRRELAEDQGASVETFLAEVTAWLDGEQADATRRQAVLSYAADQARRSKVLVSARPPSASERAAERLRDLGRRLAALPAMQRVSASWPAPIAHELARLIDDLRDRPGPDGNSLPPNPESALVQLRDAGEALIKISAAVLLQGLMARGGEAGRWARAQAFQGLSTGSWVGLLRETAKRVLADLPEGPIRAFAALARRELCPFADGFVQFRNQVIGHGLRTLDPEDTAAQLVGLIADGQFRADTGLVKLPSLMKTLEALTQADAFAGWTLSAEDADQRIELTGAEATSDWLRDPRHDIDRHAERTLALTLTLPDGQRLPLGPLLAARICGRCGRRDLLLFDSLHSTTPVGRFDLLDYARGHRSRLRGDQAEDLGQAIVGLDIPDLNLKDTSLDQADVLRLLDGARVDRRYRSPTWLRRDLAAFLAQRPGGVWWLQAPAHVGKTTFVQGLAEPGLEKPTNPIDPRFAPLKDDNPDNRPVVAFYLRKEHRPRIGGLIAGLQERLEQVFNLSSNAKQEAPRLQREAIRDLDPAGFLAWLDAYRQLGYRVANRPLGPLLVCIDGLDEAEPPHRERGWPLQILPRDEQVPDGLYLLLTSRPLGPKQPRPTAADADQAPNADEVPGFLRDHVARLYPAPAEEVGSDVGRVSAA